MTDGKVKLFFSFPMRKLTFQKGEKGQKMAINLVIRFQDNEAIDNMLCRHWIS